MKRRTFLQRIALSLPAFPFWHWSVFEQPSLPEPRELEKLPPPFDKQWSDEEWQEFGEIMEETLQGLLKHLRECPECSQGRQCWAPRRRITYSHGGNQVDWRVKASREKAQ